MLFAPSPSRRLKPLAAALALAVLFDLPGPSAQAQDGCVPAERAPAQAVRLSDVRRQVSGDILRAAVCNEAGRWVYRVTVLNPAGQVRMMVFDAGNGSPLNR